MGTTSRSLTAGGFVAGLVLVLAGVGSAHAATKSATTDPTTTTTTDVVLTGTVSGRLVDEVTRQPLADFEVAAWVEVFRGEYEFPAGARPDLTRTARTGADGRFTIEGLLPESYFLSVGTGELEYRGEYFDDVYVGDLFDLSGWWNRATRVTVESDSVVDIGDWGVARAAFIGGTVVDLAGTPIEGATVILASESPPVEFSADERTGAGGSFRHRWGPPVGYAYNPESPIYVRVNPTSGPRLEGEFCEETAGLGDADEFGFHTIAGVDFGDEITGLRFVCPVGAAPPAVTSIPPTGGGDGPALPATGAAGDSAPFLVLGALTCILGAGLLWLVSRARCDT